jgi:hypothetical protein
MTNIVKLRLYGKAGCHLCDEMLEALESLRHETDTAFTVESVDISSSPEAQHHFAMSIPVLTTENDGEVLCQTRLHRQSVLDHLASALPGLAPKSQ